LSGGTVIKLSSPATREFWEIPILFEDEHLLALDKPGGLWSSPDRSDPTRPSLLELLHRGIAEGKSWAKERGLAYLMIAHRLEAEASGVILLARSKPVLVALANFFGAEQSGHEYTALAQGVPAEDTFEIDAKIAPHPLQAGLMRVDSRNGKQSRTRFTVQEKFTRWTLLKCEPLTHRAHQIQAHLSYARLPVAGDKVYGGQSLLLSRLKGGYHLKPNRTERPLLGRSALHSEKLSLPHPVTAAPLSITAPWPKDLTVAVKYLRRYAPAS
jgi:23S rRNA pseudouridine1911/1915/1917 synthase